MNVTIIAGAVSTVIFGISNLPMLIKAVRTKDLSSYSLGSIALINLANAVHSIYVFSLPAGPIWFLHSFYLIASAVMLTLCLRYRRHPFALAAEDAAQSVKKLQPVQKLGALI
ncbi:hypothetical protein GCM10027052_18940 [Parafrigoribacterium mesophilum]|uniref:hypothetical protein n=1 Tax=Parafrigoribacterium mesophilum TaxID=433646 RepID=UPI0031FCCF69